LKNRLGLPFIAVTILLVIVSIASGYYYYASSSDIAAREKTIAARQAEIAALKSQSTNAAALQANLESASSQIATLQARVLEGEGEVKAAEAKIKTVQTDLAAANATIADLNGKLTASSAKIAELQSQNDGLVSQVNNLTAITSLAAVTTQVANSTLDQPAGQESLFTIFNANYAGYLRITGTTSSGTVYLRVMDIFHAYPYGLYRHPFGTGTEIIVPVLPGSVSVYLGNTDATGEVTGKITVEYYY
jgi:cell division protein FtsL